MKLHPAFVACLERSWIQNDFRLYRPHFAVGEDLKRRQTFGKEDPSYDNSPTIGPPSTSPKEGKGQKPTRKSSIASIGSYKQRVMLLRRQSREIFEHVERKPS